MRTTAPVETSTFVLLRLGLLLRMAFLIQSDKVPGALEVKSLTNTVTKAPSNVVTQKQLQLNDSYHGPVSIGSPFSN